MADRAFDVPVRYDTRFRVASITKLFTSVLVLMLVARGSFDLNAPLLDARAAPRSLNPSRTDM